MPLPTLRPISAVEKATSTCSSPMPASGETQKYNVTFYLPPSRTYRHRCVSRHADWADTFCVNTTAHYFLSVALLPLLAAASELDLGDGRLGRSEGRGVIVITSSCASMHNATNIDLTSYATSKAATDHLVRLLAAKFRRFYVRVVGINPGCIGLPRRVPMTKHR